VVVTIRVRIMNVLTVQLHAVRRRIHMQVQPRRLQNEQGEHRE
jgi:hypothetical protein